MHSVVFRNDEIALAFVARFHAKSPCCSEGRHDRARPAIGRPYRDCSRGQRTLRLRIVAFNTRRYVGAAHAGGEKFLQKATSNLMVLYTARLLSQTTFDLRGGTQKRPTLAGCPRPSCSSERCASVSQGAAPRSVRPRRAERATRTPIKEGSPPAPSESPLSVAVWREVRERMPRLR